MRTTSSFASLIFVIIFAVGGGLAFATYPVGVPGHAGTFWLYGLVAIAACAFSYILLPETKGKKLEQIEAHWRTGKRPREL